MVVKELQHIYEELKHKKKSLNSIESKINDLYTDILKFSAQIDESEKFLRIYNDKAQLLNALNTEKKRLESEISSLSKQLTNHYDARMKYQTHDMTQLGEILAYFVSCYKGISYEFQRGNLVASDVFEMPIFLLVRDNSGLSSYDFMAKKDQQGLIHSKVLQILYQYQIVIPLPLQQRLGMEDSSDVEYQILNKEDHPYELYVSSMNYYQHSKKAFYIEEIISDFLIQIFLYKSNMNRNLLNDNELTCLADSFIKEISLEETRKKTKKKK